MRFLVRHNRHHKVSQSVPHFMSHKTVTTFLRIKVGGHFVMSIVECYESYYVGVLDNPLFFLYQDYCFLVSRLRQDKTICKSNGKDATITLTCFCYTGGFYVHITVSLKTFDLTLDFIFYFVIIQAPI